MKQKSIQAKTAKAIRKVLKNNFPNTKFSVRSESFAGGDSVNISWTDGTTSKRVKDKVRKFQYGHFNGMIDLYESTNHRENIPQVKFVMTHREMSDEARKRMIREHNTEWVDEAEIRNLNGYNDELQAHNSQIIYRRFSKTNLEAQDE